MSNIIDFIGDKSVIKSIQRGVQTYNGYSSVNVTIASVDLDKAIVIISNQTADNRSSGTAFGSGMGGTLTNSTTLNLVSGDADIANLQNGTCFWQVVEYK